MPISTTTTRRPEESLRAVGVSRIFEGVQALEDVDLELWPHEVAGLIGPNGAGKTTLVNVLTGFDFPTSGRVELSGQDITYWQPAQRSRSGLARTFQHARIFRRLTVRENIEVAALGVGARPRVARQRANRLLVRLDLADRADTPAGILPQGDSRRLGVARALATEPQFVLLDEPAAGVPEAELPEFSAVVRAVCDEEGTGVLLIDHNMALVMEVCDRIQVIDHGRTIARGTPSEVRSNIEVITAYLGEMPMSLGEMPMSRDAPR